MSAAIPYSTTGIYLITNIVTGTVYVGSTSVSFKLRWKAHRATLRKGTHVNRYLQHAWNLHGEISFTFTPVEVVSDPAMLLTCEQVWIDRYYPLGKAHCYNLLPTAGTTRGRIVSDETRARMSDGRRVYPLKGLMGPDGTVYENIPNLSAFAREHGLDESSVISLNRGKIGYRSVKGWTRIDRPKEETLYAFRSPDGALYRDIVNITTFAREHDLTRALLSHVHSGRRPHHKGWTKG